MRMQGLDKLSQNLDKLLFCSSKTSISMAIAFNSANNLDESDYQTLTGMDFEKSIALTGIYGVHKYVDLISADADIIIYEKYPCVTVTILLEDLSLQRIINFEDCEIINDYISIDQSERRKGKGLSILLSQIEVSNSTGFRKLNCYASGDGNQIGDAKHKEQNGYMTWAKLGYTMKQKSFLKYKKLLSDNDIPLMTLERLIYAKNVRLLNGKGSLDCGLTFWTNSGISFYAEFYLGKGSENRNILSRYLIRKHSAASAYCTRFEMAKVALTANSPSTPHGHKRKQFLIRNIDYVLEIKTREKELLSERIIALV